MASSVIVRCDIVHKGLAEQFRKDKAKAEALAKAGVSDDEVTRQVYYPWKTPEQYKSMRDEYERIFAAPQ